MRRKVFSLEAASTSGAQDLLGLAAANAAPILYKKDSDPIPADDTPMEEWDPAPTISSWQDNASWWSQWWSQQPARQKWRPEDYLYKRWGEPTASSQDTSADSSRSPPMPPSTGRIPFNGLAASAPGIFALPPPRCSARRTPTSIPFWACGRCRSEEIPLDTLFQLDLEEDLRRWGADPPLSWANRQLKSRVERHEAMRKLAARTGKKGPRDYSRVPIKHVLLKQKAVVPPPVEPATAPTPGGGRFFDDRSWMDGGSRGEAQEASARGHAPVKQDYKWKRLKCERLFTKDEAYTAKSLCPGQDCDLTQLVSAMDDDAWKELSSPTAEMAVRGSGSTEATASNRASVAKGVVRMRSQSSLEVSPPQHKRTTGQRGEPR